MAKRPRAPRKEFRLRQQVTIQTLANILGVKHYGGFFYRKDPGLGNEPIGAKWEDDTFTLDASETEVCERALQIADFVKDVE